MSTPGPSAAGRAALVAGASGLVGRELLRGLLADDQVAAVHALARRPLDLQHPKLTVHTVDFAQLPPLPPIDEAYLALGTTIKVAGSEAAFRAVDFDANLAVACAAQVAGARRIGLVSAMKADAGSRIFYSRVKGELEEAIAGLGYEGVVIARPSLLVGDREALGQPERAGERIGLHVGRWLRPVIPADFRPIAARQVARALLRAVPVATGHRVLLSGEMQADALPA
ncbi:oxidoreductase [Ramlibacter monticola]|uniref:NAD(P)H-binding protein n=1 Tax=Ramlibacter monticola TaxID=1926872 RepID=A0A936YZ83_9BURK|nr:NAD(P)H-binding protein [Ramlibacter monticola]MBL0390670.1 NAD(P)H-binding protein [Ramlibacter monticola]